MNQKRIKFRVEKPNVVGEKRRHNSILKWFMNSEKSPTGRWYREVPVGIERAVDQMKEDGIPKNLEERSVRGLYSKETKKMDALCVKDNSNQLPLGWNEAWIETEKVVPSPRDYMDVWHNKENSDVNFDINFDGVLVYIVEVKGKRENQKPEEVVDEAVNQIDEYVKLFLEDWNASIENFIVVAEGISIEKAEESYPDIDFFLAEEI